MCQSMVRVVARCATLTILTVMPLAFGEGGAAAAPSVASHSHAPAPAAGPVDREIASFVKLMNAHRVALGLPALVWDRRAAAAAQAHCQDMSDRHYFSHTSPDGRSTWDRLAARGITYSQAGENIAWGQSTGRAALADWLQSPGHRANIESRSYTRHGVGRVGTYWTQVFIRPMRAPRLRARFTQRGPGSAD